MIQKKPKLEDLCGEFLMFKDLIECGETQHIKKIPNVPKKLDSYKSLYLLVNEVIDPVIRKFGMIKLTYCFASDKLIRNISKNIYPKLDQHSSCEFNQKGQLICNRLGAAADFIIEKKSMLEIAQWVTLNTDFDRLYYYGDKKPIHVSYGPGHSRQIVVMKQIENNKKIPKVTSIENFLKLS